LSNKYEVYRSRSEIIRQILEVANGSGGAASKTKLMYNALLSHEQLKKYLKILIESELLSYDLPMHKFKITEKGLTFLKVYTEIDEMLKQQESKQVEREERQVIK
jgi:predicted transcriptional regulator